MWGIINPDWVNTQCAADPCLWRYDHLSIHGILPNVPTKTN